MVEVRELHILGLVRGGGGGGGGGGGWVGGSGYCYCRCSLLRGICRASLCIK